MSVRDWPALVVDAVRWTREIDVVEASREHWRRLVASAGVLVLGGAVAVAGLWFFSWRLVPPPSIFDSPVDDVFGYLALDDFSRLPLEERMRFLQQLADRFRGMEQSDLAATSAFLAGLAGPAREQLTDNARLLAKDVLIDGASTYFTIPEAERGAYLDEWITRWVRTGERLGMGRERERTDEEILESARRDVDREGERIAERDSDRMPTPTEANTVRFLDFWQSEVEATASPREQGQIVRFMTEVRGHLLYGD